MSETGVDFSAGEGGEVTVDLNNVEDSSFEVLPKGMYNCVVDSLEFEYSQNSGNPMWSWVLEVEDGEFAGRKLFFHTVWAGKGLPITKRVISRVCPELLSGPFNPEQVAAEGNIVGRRVKARVAIRKFEGENRNNVRDLFAADEGGF